MVELLKVEHVLLLKVKTAEVSFSQVGWEADAICLQEGIEARSVYDA